MVTPETKGNVILTGKVEEKLSLFTRRFLLVPLYPFSGKPYIKSLLLRILLKFYSNKKGRPPY